MDEHLQHIEDVSHFDKQLFPFLKSNTPFFGPDFEEHVSDPVNAMISAVVVPLSLSNYSDDVKNVVLSNKEGAIEKGGKFYTALFLGKYSLGYVWKMMNG